jgi:hypothetical protein
MTILLVFGSSDCWSSYPWIAIPLTLTSRLLFLLPSQLYTTHGVSQDYYEQTTVYFSSKKARAPLQSVKGMGSATPSPPPPSDASIFPSAHERASGSTRRHLWSPRHTPYFASILDRRDSSPRRQVPYFYRFVRGPYNRIL